MNPNDEKLVRFYEDGAAAHRILDTPKKLPWSGWGILLVFLIATIFYEAYFPDQTLGKLLTSTGCFLFETLVYIVPARFIFWLDSWMNPSQIMKRRTTHMDKRDALCRIMGLDTPEGLMASVFKVRKCALSTTRSVFGRKTLVQPPGLGNIDNSCYQNSILQGLSSLHSLPDFLSKCLDYMSDGQSDSSVAETLKLLISDLNDRSNNGRTLWIPNVLKSMSSWTQQDAQEYYSKILDDIEKSVMEAVQRCRPQRGFESVTVSQVDTAASEHSDDSGYHSATEESKLLDSNPVRNPLEGLFAQRVACTQCGYSNGISMIPFNFLTLSLGLDKHENDVYERLDSFTKMEAIEDVECQKCTLLKAQFTLRSILETMRAMNIPEAQVTDQARRLEALEVALEEEDFEEKTLRDVCQIAPKSRVLTTKTKQIVIARPPQSLILHVNRSVFNPATFDMMKNSAPVQFPMTLDLGPWCLGSVDGKAGHDGSVEIWPAESMMSLIAGDGRPSRLSGPIYELRAVVTHFGHHENGHYTCYRKYPVSTAKNGSEKEEKEESIDGGESDDGVKKPKEEVVDEGYGSDVGDFGSADDGDAEKTRDRSDWWRLSDQNVMKVDEETVLSLSPGVFMLFYECVDASMFIDGELEKVQDDEHGLPATGRADVMVDDEGPNPHAVFPALTKTGAEKKRRRKSMWTESTITSTEGSISEAESEEGDDWGV